MLISRSATLGDHDAGGSCWDAVRLLTSVKSVAPAALTCSGVMARPMAREALAEPATKVGRSASPGVPRHWWLPSRARRTLHLAGRCAHAGRPAPRYIDGVGLLVGRHRLSGRMRCLNSYTQRGGGGRSRPTR
jgi:hypothetical protein